MEKHSSDLTLVPPVADRWNTVLKVRNQFAAELNQMADELPGVESKNLRTMTRWFQGPAKLEDALRRPDVMAICLPLIKNSVGDNISAAEISQAARMGFCSIGRSTSVSRRLFRRFAYPILILVATSLLAVMFSFWIAPEFEEMFAEFGIELPSLTRFVIASARQVRRWWWVVVASLAAVVLASWIWSWIAGSHSPNWLDRRLMSKRSLLAAWAWHVSLLLEAGLPQSDAVDNAGVASGKLWLRRASSKLANVLRYGAPTSEQPAVSGEKYQLLNKAMELPASPGKVTMLQEVAAYYWDRNRTVGDWWVQLLGAFVLWAVGFAVFLAIVSLFMPLIAIVSGLTGSKF